MDLTRSTALRPESPLSVWGGGKEDVVFSLPVRFSGVSDLRFGSSAEHRPRRDPEMPRRNLHTPDEHFQKEQKAGVAARG